MARDKFKRIARALTREGIDIEKEGPVYRVRRTGSEGPAAEVLLPEGYPLETKAVKQLAAFADVRHPAGGRVCRACATPDFHPGNLVPVGAVVETSDIVIPQAIGTDINCGMRMHVVDLSVDEFLSRKGELVELLQGDLLLGTRDLPMTAHALRAIYEEGLPGWIDTLYGKRLGMLERADVTEIAFEAKHEVWGGGSFPFASSKWVEDRFDGRDVVRDADLGTLGGGNHFVEFQVVEEVMDGARAWQMGVTPGRVAFMVHTGSRLVGKGIGVRWMERARDRWPAGHKWPDIFALAGEDAREYMGAMATAANFAAVNRLLIAELVRDRLRQVHGLIAASLVYDVPHNIVTQEGEGYVHRKGATPAHEGQPVLIPGSMGHSSYLMVGAGNEKFLNSASHGAGRAVTRFEMGRRERKGTLEQSSVECVTLKEERLVEEAPSAYKDIEPVIRVQVENGLVRPVARMRPLLTFKA